MFMRLALTSNYASAAALMTDLKYIITGGTDKNQLSANVDKTLTYFDASVSTSNWTVHDELSSGGRIIFKQPVYDDPSKYVYLDLNATTGINFSIRMIEGWNATTDAVIGYTTQVYSNSNGLYQGSGYYNCISASPKHLMIYGSNGGHVMLCTARTRGAGWDTAANGYIPYSLVCGASASGFHETFPLKKDDGNNTTSPTYLRNVTSFYNNVLNTANSSSYLGFSSYFPDGSGAGLTATAMGGGLVATSQIRDANGNLAEPLVPFGAAPLNTSYGSAGFLTKYSDLCDVWLVRSSLTCAEGDEIVVPSGPSYVIIKPNASGTRVAIRKG